ncbi:glycosyltransferase [Psychroflexus sp. CAK57W]|uniref:glycosyltransferase family 2 protein n=1 Tax=Psychroflexus curvus TaxID=2873595 RepID=UPI001CCC03B5|nr:glycosyltransferase family 2 protein [Psychroflexus curvus]MBZ9787853.1 glycosyltransferase [Psychroflexus curvus]
MQPFFSIIIPTYSVESFLPMAVDSILKQSFNRFEIVIMDGLSNDNTVSIAEDYSKSDTRVRVFSDKDNGIYDAMNMGIKKAKGEYLFFLGSDDTLYNASVLKSIYNSFINKPVDVLYGNVYSDRFNGIYDGIFNGEKLFYKNICHQSIFFKKTVFDKTGFFDLKYKAHADYDHNIKWFFDNKIKHRFENIIIANYADGGFSSVNGDPVFAKDKKRLFLKNAFGKVPFEFYMKKKYPFLTSKIIKLKNQFWKN